MVSLAWLGLFPQVNGPDDDKKKLMLNNYFQKKDSILLGVNRLISVYR